MGLCGLSTAGSNNRSRCQVDVLHTRWYQNRILRNSSLLLCRECGKAMETVKHILNMCEPKGVSLYKERHDRAILISVVEIVERIWIQAGRALVQTRCKTSLCK